MKQLNIKLWSISKTNQWAANGRQRSRWNGKFRSSRSRTATSMYRNISHNNTVGKQTPRSANRRTSYVCNVLLQSQIFTCQLRKLWQVVS